MDFDNRHAVGTEDRVLADSCTDVEGEEVEVAKRLDTDRGLESRYSVLARVEVDPPSEDAGELEPDVWAGQAAGQEPDA